MFHQLQNQPKAELKIRNKYDHIVSTSGGIGAIQGAGEPAGEGEEGTFDFSELSCRH